jgi:DNA-binding transcriptional MerR regulator
MISITEASERSGMRQEDISSLIHMKMIVPESYLPRGTGTRAQLSDRNIEEIRVIRRLREANVKRSYIKSIVDLLRDSKQQWWGDPNSWIVISDGRWFVTSNPFDASNIGKIKGNETTIIIKL